MALTNDTGYNSRPAAADYSAIKWPRLVVTNTSGEYATCGVGAMPHGVGQNFPLKQGEQLRASSIEGREEKCEVGAGGVTVGAKVYSDANGKLVVSATVGHIPVGIALEAAANGEVAKFEYRTLPANT